MIHNSLLYCQANTVECAVGTVTITPYSFDYVVLLRHITTCRLLCFVLPRCEAHCSFFPLFMLLGLSIFIWLTTCQSLLTAQCISNALWLFNRKHTVNNDYKIHIHEARGLCMDLFSAVLITSVFFFPCQQWYLIQSVIQSVHSPFMKYPRKGECSQNNI